MALSKTQKAQYAYVILYLLNILFFVALLAKILIVSDVTRTIHENWKLIFYCVIGVQVIVQIYARKQDSNIVNPFSDGRTRKILYFLGFGLVVIGLILGTTHGEFLLLSVLGLLLEIVLFIMVIKQMRSNQNNDDSSLIDNITIEHDENDVL